MPLPLDVAVEQYRQVKAVEDVVMFMCSHEELWPQFEDWLLEYRNIKQACTCPNPGGHHPQVIGELFAMGLDYTRFQLGAIQVILRTQGFRLTMNGEEIHHG